ncbi:MAG: molybdopterin cofactor-binding domain-containing protein [Hyphomicrobiaceae bacterium]|nr:molybdopterin cofactor-binding domain-containing protein [Hyphomicrobiaceae bacterium]
MPGVRPTRRAMVAGVLAAGGGLVVGFCLDDVAAQKARPGAGKGHRRPPAKRHELNAWLVVRSDDTVVVRLARSEMGQGALTGLAQLAAEELDCDWGKVVVEIVPPDESIRRGGPWGDYATGGSRSIRIGQLPLRRAGLAARMMLIEAAAAELAVPTSELTTRTGVIRHEATGRSLSYGKVAAAAAERAPLNASLLRLDEPAAWTIAGRPLPALDTRSKVTGATSYGIDVRLPGMLNAAIRAAPVPGGKLLSFDATTAEAMPGVRRVLAVGDDAVAVVAEGWWQASTALDKVAITWAPVAETGISSESIEGFLKSGLDSQDAFVGRTHGDALAALRAAAQTVEAVYATPFLHHATLEPMNATAVWRPDGLDVWAPTQNADAALRTAAEAGGLAPEQVKLTCTLCGGAFGRRLKQDYVRQAVLIARDMAGTPVKLIWSREEDTTHGYYRPVTRARLRGSLDDKGEPTGLIVRISGQSILASNLGRDATGQAGRDPRMFQGLYSQPGEAQMGYSIPNVYIDHAMRITHIPVGSWRGVHTTQNGVYLECFIDELAHAAKRDPLEFRRSLMKGHPRHLAVLTAATEKAGWSTATPPGVHRGLAQMMAVGSYAAVVAEVSVSEAGAVKVARVVVALDCGNIVNPRLVEAQVEGAVGMGLSATLHEEITIRDGRVVEQSFDTYRLLRLAEYPRVETVLVPSGDFWGGVGEAAIGAVPPAVLNALFRATGKRIRSLPIKGSSR